MHVDRFLPDSLTGIQEIEHASFARDFADFFSGVYQAAVGGDVSESEIPADSGRWTPDG